MLDYFLLFPKANALFPFKVQILYLNRFISQFLHYIIPHFIGCLKLKCSCHVDLASDSHN